MSKSVMLAAVVLLLLIYTCVTVTDISSIPHCLECLCMVETNKSDCSVDKTCTKDYKAHRSCGAHNLNVLYYKDCGSPGIDGKESIEIAYQRCVNDVKCSKTCVQWKMSKSLLLVAVFLFVSIYTCVTVTDISSIPHCLECLCMVETNNSDCFVEKGCIKNLLGLRSCGPLKLDVAYYKACGSPGFDGKELVEIAYQRCANDPDCAKSCMQKYTSQYLNQCNIRRSLCERYVRIHFGGPRGCSYKPTEQKWLAVESCMNSSKI